MEPCCHDKLMEGMNFVVVLFFRRAAVPKMGYIVQGLMRCCTDAQNKKWKLLKKTQRHGNSVTELAYRQATSAVKCPDLILGALTCSGTGRL